MLEHLTFRCCGTCCIEDDRLHLYSFLFLPSLSYPQTDAANRRTPLCFKAPPSSLIPPPLAPPPLSLLITPLSSPSLSLLSPLCLPLSRARDVPTRNIETDTPVPSNAETDTPVPSTSLLFVSLSLGRGTSRSMGLVYGICLYVPLSLCLSLSLGRGASRSIPTCATKSPSER